MTNKMKQKLNFILFSLTFCISAFSQQKDSIMAINRKYKKEVGIDFQGFFKSTLGTALIFKVKNNRNRYISLTTTKNFRFQLGISGTLPTNDKVTNIDTSKVRYSTQEASSFSIQPMLGMEKVNFYGKFNFYYGVDFGPYYNYTNSGYSVYTFTNYPYTGAMYSNSAGLPQQSEAKKYGLSIAPFIGAKYRLSEHFSASIESGFFVSYFASKTKIYSLPYINGGNKSTNTVIADKNYSGLDFSVKYLRFLTLNYHL